MPAAVDARLERLRTLIRESGILYSTARSPIVSLDGSVAPWMLYTLDVSLTRHGSHLAAACILDRLAGFESTQLATYGLTGIPLLQACVVLGDGTYTGLCIRTERKRHGARRQIEGPGDTSRGVVVIDDSISSGRSFRTATEILEGAGYRVEGAVCLVHFPYRGGVEWALALGYRVEALLDVWDDLQMPRPQYVAGFRRALPSSWANAAVPEGLHPAHAARWAARHFLETNDVPRPPKTFDRDYEARGGVYVSFRHVKTDLRVARDGFWHFCPEDSDPHRDLVLATIKTVRTSGLPLTLDCLEKLKVAVSFFGPLEEVSPRALDFSRYGIVVRSKVWPTKVGGALPNTQVFTSEVEQFRHARFVNAQLGRLEPYELYRHEVFKNVEPGAYWPPYGTASVPWPDDDAIGKAAVQRARSVLRAAIEGTSLDGDGLDDALIPAPVEGVAVTLYRHGSVVGCSVSQRRSLDESVQCAVRSAVADERYRDSCPAESLSDVDLCISILHDAEWIGVAPIKKVARKLRPGLDSFSVHQGPDKAAFFLECVVPYYNWTTEEAAERLVQKAKIAEPPYSWATYQTASWIDGRHGLHALEFGLTRRSSSRNDAVMTQWHEMEMLAGYLYRSLDRDGLPLYRADLLTGAITKQGTAARLVDALAALADAGRFCNNEDWIGAAGRGLRTCASHTDTGGSSLALFLEGQRPSRQADFGFLESASRFADALDQGVADALARKLSVLCQPDGRIAEPSSPPSVQEHDFLPGAALLAFAEYCRHRQSGVLDINWQAHLAFYRRRFRLLQPWGLAAWHMQAWSSAANLWNASAATEFVFEMADWALRWQLDASGAFLTDLSPDGPSFHTAFILEGIADAWKLALASGDESRARRYQDSWERGTQFMSRLIVHPEDTFWTSRELAEVGAVRAALTSTDVRIDYISHTLKALVNGLSAWRHGARESASHPASPVPDRGGPL